MIPLGLSLISTPEGLKVVKNQTNLTSESMVYYSLTDMAHIPANPRADFMSPDHLHLTALVSHGPNVKFEDAFYKDLNDPPTLFTLYWRTSRCATSVSSSQSQQKVFMMDNFHQHVSLGPFVQKCEQIADRKPTSDTAVMFLDSLLQAGVIVPFPNSLVRTPIFPVKKVTDVGKPTEWRLVQDLKAVNAAVHARAPNVPNPYTILAQVSDDSQWFSLVDLSIYIHYYYIFQCPSSPR